MNNKLSMKKILYFCALLFVATGCLSPLDELQEPDSREKEAAFTIDEAQEIFESAYTSKLTKSGGETHRTNLSPGDFTPLWETGIYESYETAASYDVRISAGRKAKALRVGECGTSTFAQQVNVYQKIVVVKSTESGNSDSYVLSLIPDAGYDYGSRILTDFVNMKKVKGRFTGLAVYTTLVDNNILRVDRYVSGLKEDGVFIGDTSRPMEQLCRKCAWLMSGIRLKSKAISSTKAGEDYWGDNGYWPDEDYNQSDGNPYDGYIDNGDGVFTDGNGNWAIDLDGDGIPDESCLGPSYCGDEQGGETGTETGTETGLGPYPDPDPYPGYDPDKVWDLNNYDDYYWQPDKTEPDKTEPVKEDTHFKSINNMDTKSFVKYSEAGDCRKCCHAIMQKMGLSEPFDSRAKVIYLVRENDSHTALLNYGDNVAKNYENAINCINDHLEVGRPIIVGVNHSLDRKYNDGTIDHFVLIVGSGHDEESDRDYYIYVETGSNYIDKSINPEENRFYFDETCGMFVDPSDHSGRVLTLTEVRPNNDKEYDTIVQPAKN